MATQKAIKLKEDAHRKHLEDSLLEIARIMEEMLEMLNKLSSSPHQVNKQGLKRRIK